MADRCEFPVCSAVAQARIVALDANGVEIDASVVCREHTLTVAALMARLLPHTSLCTRELDSPPDDL